MKTSQKLLVALTIAFSAFILGFFTGRNLNRTPIQIQALPAVTVAATESPALSEPAESAIININTASSERLQTLPGIGSVIAGRIVAYRDEFGPFESIGELINVSGIGEKKLEGIWDLVTIGG